MSNYKNIWPLRGKTHWTIYGFADNGKTQLGDPVENEDRAFRLALETANRVIANLIAERDEQKQLSQKWSTRYQELRDETEAGNYHNDANFKDLERNYNELHEQVVVAIRLLQIVINDSSYSHTQKNGALRMICRWLDQPGAGGEIIDSIPF